MPTFADIDNLYGSTVCKLSTAERLRYCADHLDSAQRLLEKHSQTLDSHQRNQLRSRVKAIQAELKVLARKAGFE